MATEHTEQEPISDKMGGALIEPLCAKSVKRHLCTKSVKRHLFGSLDRVNTCLSYVGHSRSTARQIKSGSMSKPALMSYCSPTEPLRRLHHPLRLSPGVRRSILQYTSSHRSRNTCRVLLRRLNVAISNRQAACRANHGFPFSWDLNLAQMGFIFEAKSSQLSHGSIQYQACLPGFKPALSTRPG